MALSLLAGLALSGWLLASYGLGRILDLLGHAGWLGLGAVVLFHLVQIAFSAQAWRSVSGPTPARPSLGGFGVLRWIREGTNNLLPVAQIGGELVAARLLQRRGVPLPLAVAGCVCDLTMEMLTQIAFTLLGLWLLLSGGSGREVEGTIVAGLVVAAMAAAGFLAAQWLGLARLIERGLMRLGRAIGWGGFGEVRGLHEALVGLYRAPARLAGGALNHSVSWLLGGVEVCLALHVLGHDVSLSAGTVIESLGQALKAAGFAVPGALGVQEGGLVVICGFYGLSPELAIALSLVKRLREVVLGVPALVAWQAMRSLPVPGKPVPRDVPGGFA